MKEQWSCGHVAEAMCQECWRELAAKANKLVEERDEWQQCCETEASLRREFLRRIERLEAALEPFARNAKAVSLSQALGHIDRVHLLAAKAILEERGDSSK